MDILREQADAIFNRLFEWPRDPRSDAYKAGVKAGIYSKLGIEPAHNPYAPGTAESDAWFSGNDEGRSKVKLAAVTPCPECTLERPKLKQPSMVDGVCRRCSYESPARGEFRELCKVKTVADGRPFKFWWESPKEVE